MQVSARTEVPAERMAKTPRWGDAWCGHRTVRGLAWGRVKDEVRWFLWLMRFYG